MYCPVKQTCDTEYLIAGSIVTSIMRKVLANKDFYFSLNCKVKYSEVSLLHCIEMTEDNNYANTYNTKKNKSLGRKMGHSLQSQIIISKNYRDLNNNYKFEFHYI